MRLPQTGTYIIGGLLSCGVSQVVGIVGLVGTGVKSLWDIAHKTFYESKLKNCHKEFYTEYKNKLTKYNDRLHNDKNYAKTFGLSMIPIAGIYLASKHGSFGGELVAQKVGKFKPIRKVVRFMAYPYSKMSVKKWEAKTGRSFVETRKNTLKKLGGEQTHLTTKDGRRLDAVWVASANSKAPTVIVFHGNNMILDDMAPVADFFKENEMNVLLVTMGGYPNSSDSIRTTELSTYHDAQAAVDYTLNRTGQPIDRALAYGYSIGGSLAFQAGAANPGLHVISAQTFSDLKSVPGNVLPKRGPDVLGRGFFRSEFSVGKNDGTYTRDGLNNRKKAELLQGTYFGIQSSQDQLMRDHDGHNLNEDLVEAYLKHPSRQHLNKDDISLEFTGKHGASFTHFSHARYKVAQHLRNIGFVAEP